MKIICGTFENDKNRTSPKFSGASKIAFGGGKKEKSFRIAELFFQNFDLSKINFLHCFLPIEKFNEIDTRPIFEKIWRDFPNMQTLVPRVNFQTNEIENLKFSPETETEKNTWEIFEPTHNEQSKPEKLTRF